MKLSEYTPDQILLDNNTTQAIVDKYEKSILSKAQKEQYRDNTIIFIINFIISALALVPSITQKIIWLIIVECVVLLIFLTFIIIYAYRWSIFAREYKNNRLDKDLFEYFRERASKNTKYTGIARVVSIQDDEVRYLVDKSRLFLPYFNLDVSTDLKDQTFRLIQALRDNFNIKKNDIIDIQLVDSNIKSSIKPIKNQLVTNVYAFYDVQIKVSKKKTYIKQLKWLSLSEMKNNPTAMGNNKDIIEILEELPLPKDSFSNTIGKVKIIWNITAKCSHKCRICATYAPNRTELSTEEKLKVLNEIYEAKEYVKSIDFAGGDPFCSQDSIQIIQNAIQQFGSDRISVTTTGIGLQRITQQNLAPIKNYEITIDAAHDNLSKKSDKIINRDAKEYVSENITQLKNLLVSADNIIINVPIINTDLSNEEIDCLINQISSIKNESVQTSIEVLLLRLMPVGKAGDIITRNGYCDYNPLPVINKIIAKLKQKQIKYKLHCSLRFLYSDSDEHCNMLENKIGIDCAGNVFACAWGGYFKTKQDIKENPFYLGNLTQNKLVDILQGAYCTEGYKRIQYNIQAKKHRKFCSVISYYMSTYSALKVYENMDSLSLLCQKKKKH